MVQTASVSGRTRWDLLARAELNEPLHRHQPEQGASVAWCLDRKGMRGRVQRLKPLAQLCFWARHLQLIRLRTELRYLMTLAVAYAMIPCSLCVRIDLDQCGRKRRLLWMLRMIAMKTSHIRKFKIRCERAVASDEHFRPTTEASCGQCGRPDGAARHRCSTLELMLR